MSEQSDAELIDAALDAFWQSMPVEVDPEQMADAAAQITRSLARQPAASVRHGIRLAAEQAKILAGTSEVEPAKGDRRFGDDWWESNPFYRRLAQSYLAWNREVHGLVDDLELEDETRLAAGLLTNLFTDAMAPTNFLLGNPAAIKEAINTKGESLRQGWQNFLDDAKNNGGMPRMVDSEPFVPGETVATSPGSVVFQNEILELIQYQPTTEKVRQRPLLIVPPQINKYYILDLSPGRSLVEHIVGQGHQTFMISWRNPTADHRDWSLDDYVRSILEASDAAREITGCKTLNLLGVCAGGMTSAATMGYLAAKADHRIKSASFLVTVLDWEVPSLVGSIMSGPMIEASRATSQAQGILSGEELGKLFAWLRPNDLVWNYWVNNYLMGKKPPAFDVLSWNCDSTNLPAAIHSDFLDIAESNGLTKPNEVVVGGLPIDLHKVDCPSFVVGAVTDHITPWQACYQTVNILGGESEFVLSSQGHIQALVNPSGNPKGRFYTNSATPASADEWRDGAEEHAGSWWDHWATWLTGHGGRLVNAPAELGSEAHPVQAAAPGAYVLEQC